MTTFRALLVSTAVGAVTGSTGSALAAPHTSKDAQIEALTRRLEHLEEKLEAAEARGGKTAEVQTAPPDSPALKQLNQKVKILERKLEVEHEVAETNARKLPRVEDSPGAGLKITSPEGDHQLRLRGYLQADGNFFMDDSRNDPKGSVDGIGSGVDKFVIRRARLQFDGTLWKYVDFRLSPDFGGGQVRLFDGYVDIHYFPFASLTAGKQKGPISLERLQSATALTFAERAFPTQLAPNRDLGVLIHGEFAGPGYSTTYGGPHNFSDLLSYQVGVFNGTRDNGFGDTDSDDNKEFEGRIFSHPFLHAGIPALAGLGLGVAGSWGQPTRNALPSLVSPGQNRIVTYVGSNAATATADGDHFRVYPQAYWYWGPLGLLGEYVRSSQSLLSTSGGTGSSAKTLGRTTQNNSAWQIAVSYVLTGENSAFQGVRPRHAFDPFNGEWGALQLAARFSELDVDDQSFAKAGAAYLYADPRNSVSKATSWAVGANWYLNSNVKLMADYEQTHFDGGAQDAQGNVKDRANEKVFFTRFQFAY